MKIADTKLKKAILIVVATIILTITVVILLISPITKYLIEKYAEKYTGRQIKMSWIYVNPFTGYFHISNLKIYESKSFPGYKKGDSIFFSANGVSASFALRKLFSKTIEISSLTLDKPKGIVIQNKDFWNFTDIIHTFTPKKPSTAPSKYHFNIFDVKIVNGTFFYRDEVTPINYFIREVHLESTGKPWNSDTLLVKFSISSGPTSGTAKGTFMINFNTLDYRFVTVIQKLDLKFLEQYFNVLANYGTLSGSLDIDGTATGNFKDQDNIDTRGLLSISDFHVGKIPGDDYAACEKIVLRVDELSPINHKYNFDSLSVIHPFFKYERYDSLDNLQMMFGVKGSNLQQEPEKFNLILSIARYIKGLADNFFESDFKIKRVGIYRGDLKFSDFSISEKFTVDADPVFFSADSINKDRKRVYVFLKSGIKPYGNIAVDVSINPKDKADFDLHGSIRKVPVPLFNPYLVTYSSYDLDRGTIEFNGTWNVNKGVLNSVNHLVIIDPRQTRRVRNKDTKWLPVPLIMALIRERGNVIDYEIPITGDLKNPKFHLHDVLMDLLKNIIVKPATTPYRVEVKKTEVEIEKSQSLKWKMRQGSLLPTQEKFVSAMVEFLVKNPDAIITVSPMVYAEKEKEQILFFEAKKKYFLASEGKKALDKDDSVKVDKMSVKESSFVHFLNKIEGNNLLFTIQEKCAVYTGKAIIDKRFDQLNKEREEAFLGEFKQKGVQDRIKISPRENTIPYNGFSYFKIVYKGEIPGTLAKAYQKMNELNDKPPRKQYKSDRKKEITDIKN